MCGEDHGCLQPGFEHPLRGASCSGVGGRLSRLSICYPGTDPRPLQPCSHHHVLRAHGSRDGRWGAKGLAVLARVVLPSLERIADSQHITRGEAALWRLWHFVFRIPHASQEPDFGVSTRPAAASSKGSSLYSSGTADDQPPVTMPLVASFALRSSPRYACSRSEFQMKSLASKSRFPGVWNSAIHLRDSTSRATRAHPVDDRLRACSRPGRRQKTAGSILAGRVCSMHGISGIQNRDIAGLTVAEGTALPRARKLIPSWGPVGCDERLAHWLLSAGANQAHGIQRSSCGRLK